MADFVLFLLLATIVGLFGWAGFIFVRARYDVRKTNLANSSPKGPFSNEPNQQLQHEER